MAETCICTLPYCCAASSDELAACVVQGKNLARQIAPCSQARLRTAARLKAIKAAEETDFLQTGELPVAYSWHASVDSLAVIESVMGKLLKVTHPARQKAHPQEGGDRAM